MPAQQTIYPKSCIQTEKVCVATPANSSIIGSTIIADEPQYYYAPIEENSTASDISTDLKHRLVNQGVDSKTAETARLEILSILSTQYPEVEAIPALRSLRQQFQAENSHTGRIKRFEGIPKYSTKSGRDPLSFFQEEYRELIGHGPIITSQIQRTDPNLYVYLKNYLARPEAPESDPKTIAELLEALTGPAMIQPLQKRIQECAALLNTDAPNAARFFANVRPDLVLGVSSGNRSR